MDLICLVSPLFHRFFSGGIRRICGSRINCCVGTSRQVHKSSLHKKRIRRPYFYLAPLLCHVLLSGGIKRIQAGLARAASSCCVHTGIHGPQLLRHACHTDGINTGSGAHTLRALCRPPGAYSPKRFHHLKSHYLVPNIVGIPSPLSEIAPRRAPRERGPGSTKRVAARGHGPGRAEVAPWAERCCCCIGDGT